MFAVFRSLHMKLMLILLLLITSLMAVVGAFLTTSVSSFYIDTFYEQISAVFSDDSDGYVSTLRARAAEPDGAAGIKEMLEGRAGSLGIDYRTRNYFILDGQSGTYLDGSAEASELPREQTANLLTARNAVAQGDSTLWETAATSPPTIWTQPSPSWGAETPTSFTSWTTRTQ